MPIPFAYNFSLDGHVQVKLGSIETTVQRLEQERTYGGLMEGVPNAAFNDRILEPIRRASQGRGFYFIEPQRRDFLRTPGDMADVRSIGGRPPEWLPMVYVSMRLQARPSWVEVRFFQDEFAPPLDDRIGAALLGLDWYARAEGVDDW
jgi:hypothetical protein